MNANISPYDSRTEKIRQLLCGEQRAYKTNKIYKAAASEETAKAPVLYYINQKGYIHLLLPRRVKFNSATWYEIDDYILTADNYTRYTAEHSRYKSESEMLAALNSIFEA